MKEEEMGEQARCALREAAMVVAAGRRAGSSKILFTIHAGVVRRALCRSAGRSVGRSVLHHDHARCERANERARCQISKEGKIAFLPFSCSAPTERSERRLPMPNCHHSTHSDLRGVPE